MNKLTIFVAFLFVSNISIYLFTGKGVTYEKVSISENNPQIILKNFKLLEIDESGSVNTTLSGLQGLSYEGGVYKIKKINLLSVNSEVVETISGDYAFYREKTLDISGNAKYNRSDGSQLETARISFDVEKNIFYIPSNFIFTMSNTVVYGNSLHIMRDTGVINAQNIKATLIR
jgi:LPS export ABC transporter protein LptC